MAKPEPKRTKADIVAKRERIISDWADCWPSLLISQRHDCSQSNVHRIIREYGEPDHPNRTERGIEMKRAEFHSRMICESYNAGQSIDQIAKATGLMAREVRAAVFMGIQRGEVSAFLPGVVDEAAEKAACAEEGDSLKADRGSENSDG